MQQPPFTVKMATDKQVLDLLQKTEGAKGEDNLKEALSELHSLLTDCRVENRKLKKRKRLIKERWEELDDKFAEDHCQVQVPNWPVLCALIICRGNWDFTDDHISDGNCEERTCPGHYILRSLDGQINMSESFWNMENSHDGVNFYLEEEDVHFPVPFDKRKLMDSTLENIGNANTLQVGDESELRDYIGKALEKFIPKFYQEQ